MSTSNHVNPDDFIITRKRKLYKFALFANSPICFEAPEWDKTWQADVIEVGAGTGLFSVALAEAHPGKHFVAIDVKADRLQTGARLAAEKGLVNIRFLRARADQIDDLFIAATVSDIWITFPDPFPKKRSSRRRLTHPVYLQKYQSLLGEGGTLSLKHDNPSFFHWSLEQLVSEQWMLHELSFDLHDSELDDQYKIMTTYETRWLSEGLVTHFVKATPTSV